ncbi:MAG TPA: aminopeptidase P N-terminal domain-containing protein [Clostridiales bacterium]|nr:aminopeptidase P N-terminal domain-containing protein [Clostridiales bacterium]
MHKEVKFSADFFKKKREVFAGKLNDNSVTFILSAIDKIKNRDTFFKFRQDPNFFYLTGLELKRSVLVILKSGGKTTEIIFRKFLDPTLEKWVGKNMPEKEITAVSGIKDIRDIKELDDFYRQIFNGSGIVDVFMYNEYIPELIVPTYTHVFASNLRQKFSFINIRPVNSILDTLRLVKDKCEIDMIRRAIDITAAGLDEILKELKPGMSENECEGILTGNYLKYGSVQPAFQTIAASGEMATVLHYEDNNRKFSKGELILLDTGAEYKNYAADISRTYPVSGRYTPEQKKFYNIVLDASKAVMKALKPGISIPELQEITKETLYKGLYDLKMVKEKSDLSNYYYHGVSHYLGIDTHDVGSNQLPLKKGNVITVEPGLYIAEKKIGIRLENDVMITAAGCENLSAHIPIEITEIEDIMNRRKRK